MNAQNAMTILYFGTYEETYSRNQIMIKSLKKMGHVVKECHISLWGDKIDKSKTLVGIFSKLTFVFRLSTIYPRLFFKYLFIGNHDVIFVGYFGHLDMLFAKLFTSITFRKKTIVFDAFLSLYDSMVTDRRMLRAGSLFANIVYWLDETACRFADVVILDTNAHIEFFHQTFGVPKEKMVRIFASADADIFYPRQIKKKHEKCNILFMGKYIPLHGIEYIVAAAEILRNDKDIEFTFIGKGQLYPKIKQMVQDKRLDNIEFIEWVQYEELPNYIAKADVCLGIFAASDKAARVIPNKVFQCMAMEKAIITGSTPGINECLKDEENALLCKPADPDDLAKAILKLKQNQLKRKKLTSSARHTFSQALGETAIIHGLNEVLEKVVF